MGEGTSVTSSRPIQAGAGQRPLRLTIDVPLLLVVVTLVVFGLLMVFSASWDASLMLNRPPTYIFTRQIMWVGLGTLAAAFLTFFNYHRMRRLLVPMVLVTVVLLVLVLWVKDERFNATRSLLSGSVQPSELAKLVTIVYLSFWMYSKQDKLNDIQFGLVPMAAILGFLSGLIVLQPDLSATFTVMFLGCMLFFLAGGDWRQIVFMFLIALVVGFIMVKIVPTGSSRISSYIEGLRNPTEASYHVRRSLEAVVQGGWFGVGIGQASTKFIGLPVPATDSIFAVIAEETGLVGASFVIALYLLLLWRGLAIARSASDQLGALLAAGLTLWLVSEALINMTVIVGLLPIAGNALPFISAGGSNLIMSLAAVGIIMNVARTSSERDSSEGRGLSAVVDLRRRDGGRRVSRADRLTSPRK